MRLANLSFQKPPRRGRDEKLIHPISGFNGNEPDLLCVSDELDRKPTPMEAANCLGINASLIKDQPSDKELVKKFLRPLSRADLVLQTNWRSGVNEVRSSVVQDMDKNYLYLAQTSPPFLPSMKGQGLEITFLDYFRRKDGSAWFRAGYGTELVDVLKPGIGGDFASDSLLVFKRPETLAATSARMSHRLSPTKDMIFSLRILPYLYQPLTLSDISLGGLSFSHHASMDVKQGRQINLRLLSGLNPFYLNATVQYTRSHGLFEKLAATKFLNVPDRTRRRLHLLLNQMTRHMLALRSRLYAKED